MRVHHLQCATLCPPLGWAVNEQRYLVCHVLLVETEDGLALVDTGLGSLDMATPSRLTRAFRALTGPRLDPETTALAQIRRLGFSPKDVRHLLPTHLDLDHAGGLSDFPQAKVHIDARELESALSPRTAKEKGRYLARQWRHSPLWVRHRARGERWFGFECVRDVPGLPPDLLIVPLYGHTRGHVGIAVRTGQGWLLHAGDAYFYRGEMEARPHKRLGIALLERFDDVDHRARVENQARLRQLKADHDEVRVFCAHDPSEYDACHAAEQRAYPARASAI